MGDVALPLYCVSQLKAGQVVKAKDADGVFSRAEVVDVVSPHTRDGRESVKVRWDGVGPKSGKWVHLDDVRFINQFSVDWGDILEKLPVSQDPKNRAQRKAVFKDWCAEGSKSLTLGELHAGVMSTLGDEIGRDIEEVKTVVTIAWNAARDLALSKRKTGAKRVDLKEFHAFIVMFRYYLELAELFENVDSYHEDDQMLSLRELRKEIDQLTRWGITEQDLRVQFADVEPWTPKWKFQDFAKFCVERRWGELKCGLELDSDDEEVLTEKGRAVIFDAAGVEAPAEGRREARELREGRRKVVEAFAQWDTDRSGTISLTELSGILSALDPNITPAVAKVLFAKADLDKNGSVDYEEFCLWLFA